MDKIWDRKSFEVGGHWPLWRGWKKRMTMQNRQKSNAKKNTKKHENIFKMLCNFHFSHTCYFLWTISTIAELMFSTVGIDYLGFTVYMIDLLFSDWCRCRVGGCSWFCVKGCHLCPKVCMETGGSGKTY